MLVVAERDVQLRHRLPRQQLLQITDKGVGWLQVHVEMGACEAEENAHVLHIREHGVHQEATLAMKERQDQRWRRGAGQQPADQVSALTSKERGRENFRAGDVLFGDPEFPQLLSDEPGHTAGVAPPVLVRHVQPAIAEDCLHQAIEIGRPVRADQRVRLGRRRRVEVGLHVLDVAVDALSRKNPARERAEEGLGQVPILAPGDQARVDGLHGRPDQTVRDASVEQGSDAALQLTDHEPVKLEPLDRVRDGALPLASLEAATRAPCQRLEPALVIVEGVPDRGCHPVREPAGRDSVRPMRTHGASVGDSSAWRRAPRLHKNLVFSPLALSLAPLMALDDDGIAGLH